MMKNGVSWLCLIFNPRPFCLSMNIYRERACQREGSLCVYSIKRSDIVVAISPRRAQRLLKRNAFYLLRKHIVAFSTFIDRCYASPITGAANPWRRGKWNERPPGYQSKPLFIANDQVNLIKNTPPNYLEKCRLTFYASWQSKFSSKSDEADQILRPHNEKPHRISIDFLFINSTGRCQTFFHQISPKKNKKNRVLQEPPYWSTLKYSCVIGLFMKIIFLQATVTLWSLNTKYNILFILFLGGGVCVCVDEALPYTEYTVVSNASDSCVNDLWPGPGLQQNAAWYKITPDRSK